MEVSSILNSVVEKSVCWLSGRVPDSRSGDHKFEHFCYFCLVFVMLSCASVY